jgi:hypothetical protein
MAVTVHTPIARHLFVYVMAAVAAVALVASVLVGMAIADSDSDPAPASRTSSGSVHEAPSTFDGSPDAIERRATSDPARYGSPDAAEEWNR